MTDKEKEECEKLRDIMDNACNSITAELKEFRKQLDATKKKEYLATAMLFTGIIMKVLEQYHMDVTLGDFTRFLNEMRNEFKDLCEDDDDESPCDCGHPDCKPVMKGVAIDASSEKGQALMKEIINHLERIHGKGKKE